MGDLIGGLGIIGILIFSVLFIFVFFLWILLPFAVFGIKSRLDLTNSLLKKLLIENKQINPKNENSKSKFEVTIAYDNNSIDDCLNCSYLDNKNYRCVKTGYKLDRWKEKFYPESKMNPCEGKYFKEKN
ncbi:MAG: hypothetical protein GF353_05525 [Candidatus Lokiarchaeota archaeon]|nr:hypothetical protein [Candidatus Lokiarchaeota archaeon]